MFNLTSNKFCHPCNIPILVNIILLLLLLLLLLPLPLIYYYYYYYYYYIRGLSNLYPAKNKQKKATYEISIMHANFFIIVQQAPWNIQQS